MWTPHDTSLRGFVRCASAVLLRLSRASFESCLGLPRFHVDSHRRASAVCCVASRVVEEFEVLLDATSGFVDAGIRVQENLFVLQAAPQPLDEDVV